MNCIFCKIVSGELPANKVFENDDIMAFNDINPQAPKHILIIPKRHIPTIDDLVPEDSALLGNMILCAKQIAHKEQLSENGYRLIFNIKSAGGQEVYHIHLHLLGGRQMMWPPG